MFREKRSIYLNTGDALSLDSGKRAEGVLNNTESANSHNQNMIEASKGEIQPVEAGKAMIDSAKELVTETIKTPLQDIKEIAHQTLSLVLNCLSKPFKFAGKIFTKTKDLVINTGAFAVSLPISAARIGIDAVRLVPRVPLIITDKAAQAIGAPSRKAKELSDKVKEAIPDPEAKVTDIQSKIQGKIDGALKAA